MDEFASAATVFANTDGGTAAVNFSIFSQLYTAIFDPFHNAVSGVSSALSSTAAGWVTAGVVVLIMIFAAAMALQYESTVFDKLITKVLVPAAIVLFLLRGHYQEFIIDPATNFTAETVHALSSSVGGTTISGGAPFDALWNKAIAAAVAAWTHLPSSFFDPKGWAAAALICLYVIGAGAAIGLSFVLFLVSQVALYMLLAIGPIFVAFGASVYTRFLLKGWISVVASVLCTEMLVLALLGITMKVEDTIISPLLSAAANQNIYGMIDSLVIVGILLFCCAFLALKASSYAAGICGGVVDSGAAWIGAGISAAREAGGAAGGLAGKVAGVGGTTDTALGLRRFNVAGKSMSGG